MPRLRVVREVRKVAALVDAAVGLVDVGDLRRFGVKAEKTPEDALADLGADTVYELETSGKRLGTVPAEVKDGKLCFTAAVDGPHGARMLYEVVRK